MFASFPSRAGTLHRRPKGAVLIEAAIGISVFLCLLIIGMDLMRLAYINYAGRYVAEQSARAAAAGDHTLSPDARVPSIKQNIIAIARA
ncbi:MAG TPA: hypothetical protein PLP17_07520, partial [Oligoflexia bacterium]|nr:hypothetical protein [Oligoflexia bacterium]